MTVVVFDNEVTAPSMFPEPEPFAKTPSVGAPNCVVLPTVLTPPSEFYIFFICYFQLKVLH